VGGAAAAAARAAGGGGGRRGRAGGGAGGGRAGGRGGRAPRGGEIYLVDDFGSFQEKVHLRPVFIGSFCVLGFTLSPSSFRKELSVDSENNSDVDEVSTGCGSPVLLKRSDGTQ